MTTRYQQGQISPISTPVAPLTGTTYMQPTNAIGESLQQLGEHGVRIAQAYQQTNDARHLIESEQDMQKAQLDFGKWQAANPEESTWLPEWEKRTSALQKSFDKRPISDNARLGLTRSFSSWSGSQMLNLQGQAVRQAGTRARQAASNTIQVSTENGDGGTAHAAVNLLHSTGNTTPEEAEAMHIAIDGKLKSKAQQDAVNYSNAATASGDFETATQAIQNAPFTDSEKKEKLAILGHQKEVSSLITIANDDPRRAIELAYAKEKSGGLPGPDRVRIVDTANARLNELRSNSVKDLTSRIQMGVPDKEKVAGEIMDNANLEPVDKANLAAFLDRGPVNDPVTYASLYAEAKNFDGKEGSPEFSRLLSRVDMTLKEDQKSSVIAALGESVKAPKDSQNRAKNAIYAQMADDLKAGMFGDTHGSLDRPNAALPPNVRAAVDSIRGGLLIENKVSPEDQKKPDVMAKYERDARVKWWENQPDKSQGEHFNAYMIEDEGLKRAASDRAWAAMASLEKWQTENPKATPQEARSYYEGLLVRQRAAGNVSPLLPSAVETPKVDLNEILKRHATNTGK